MAPVVPMNHYGPPNRPRLVRFLLCQGAEPVYRSFEQAPRASLWGMRRGGFLLILQGVFFGDPCCYLLVEKYITQYRVLRNGHS